jgi:hypothetical protein
MHPRLIAAALASIAFVVALTMTVRTEQRTPSASPAGTQVEVIRRIVAAAQSFLGTLDDAGRAKVQFSFDDLSQKTRWSNLPSGAFTREGLRLGDLTSPQREAVMTLLTLALSRDGLRKVQDIMRGDEVLKQTDGGRGPGPAQGPGRGGPGRGGGGRGGARFGADEYYIAFVGIPSATAPWLLQFGGHHLAINLTLAGNEASMTPSLPAAQPARYTLEGRTIRPLGNENDKAFALINALDAGQRAQAILPYRVADLVLGPGQDGRTIQPEGIRASALTSAQQTMLWDLVHEWAGIMNDAFAEPRMADIRSKAGDTYFAWSGPATNGSAAYFRIQGPTLVIEYAPQSSVDHIHTIYRDPTNDYGVKFARKP